MVNYMVLWITKSNKIEQQKWFDIRSAEQQFKSLQENETTVYAELIDISGVDDVTLLVHGDDGRPENT